jgi:hypothetical protein
LTQTGKFHLPQFPKGMADAVTGAMQTAVSALPSLNSFTLPTAQAAPSAPPTTSASQTSAVAKTGEHTFDLMKLMNVVIDFEGIGP